jgi:hypothetical protein
MLQEHNGADPILIDWDLLCHCNAKVKVYPCKWNGCTLHLAVEHMQIAKHFRQRHGANNSTSSEEVSCLWTNCHSPIKPDNLPRHILSMHIGERWICLTCGKRYPREDAFRRHTQESPNCQLTQPVISYGDEIREIDTECIAGGWSIDQNVLCIP